MTKFNLAKEVEAVSLYREGSKMLERMLQAGTKITVKDCKLIATDLSCGDEKMVKYLTDSLVSSYAV